MKQINNNYLPSLEVLTPREVEIHYKRPLFSSMQSISSASELSSFLKEVIDPNRIDHKEFFWLILLNSANKILGFAEIGKGSDTSVVVNRKEIFQLLLKSNASAFIVAHNHPSGRLVPSNSDKQETEKLKEIAELLSLTFLDHLIITSESYYSFTEDNML